MSIKILRGEFRSRYNKHEVQQKGLDSFGMVNFVEENLLGQPYNSDKKPEVGFFSEKHAGSNYKDRDQEELRWRVT